MPRDGAIIFRDLVGKLEVLNLECDKCGRRGRYRVDRLIEQQYGLDAKLFDWEPEADCPRKQAKNLNDQCWARLSGLVEGSVTRRSSHYLSDVTLPEEDWMSWENRVRPREPSLDEYDSRLSALEYQAAETLQAVNDLRSEFTALNAKVDQILAELTGLPRP